MRGEDQSFFLGYAFGYGHCGWDVTSAQAEQAQGFTGETDLETVPLIHPGEILLKDLLGPLGISQYALAKAIDVPRRRINEIVQGHRTITADTAARLGAFFGVDAEGRLALQAHYDTEVVRKRLSDVLAHIPRYDCIPRHRIAALTASI